MSIPFSSMVERRAVNSGDVSSNLMGGAYIARSSSGLAPQSHKLKPERDIGSNPILASYCVLAKRSKAALS